MKKLLPILFFILLSFGAFSQKNYYGGTVNITENSLLEEKGLIGRFCHNKPTKMFIGTNEEKYSFLDTTAWTYNKVMYLNKEPVKNKSVTFKVGKVIGNAKFYFNDKLFLETNNGFKSYKLDVREFLKVGDNELKIVFTPISHSLNYDNNKYNTLASEKRVINRYPQYLFGWDWHPKML
ncbi:MAG: hypothetical protein PHX48_07210 [Bacteroidales bacterium]|nr:hypothetical protein [Bacteroidales bacterium]